jgi:probable F420-dependent oxidoreductase
VSLSFGVALGRMNPSMFLAAAQAADELGFESLWLPEHLVLPVKMAGSPFPGAEHPPIPPSTPVFDSLAYLCFIAGRTSRIRLGTHVYNLALRHPFAAARAIQTLDVVSEGRAEIGVGAGWLREEWDAAGLDFSTRGQRLDEALEVCKSLWTDEVTAHDGRFFKFAPVAFEPKCRQSPHPPILIGGESPAALERAARNDGWIGMNHDARSAAQNVRVLADLREREGLGGLRFNVTVGGDVSDDRDVEAYLEVGVHRLIVSPWATTRDVLVGLETFARRFVA